MSISNYLLIFLIFGSFFVIVNCSIGDSSPFYQKCVERCAILNCTTDGLEFINDILQPYYLRLLRWTCEDECKYDCMWSTVESFHKRNWKTPQFYGKWPFIRMFGIQEPASVVFSLMNLYIHYTMFRKFKRHVPNTAPNYYLWHIFTAVCIHAWIWSTIFHARDTKFTEFMDYICAFSMIKFSFYCMLRRIFQHGPRLIKLLINVLCFTFFINHVTFLSQGIDYGYNMKVNVILGATSAITWFAWCLFKKNIMPYTWKCALFYTLGSLLMILEIFDFPPIFWIFDSHSLWHFSGGIITPIFYWFIIDDCQYLSYQTYKKFEEKMA